MAPQLERQRLGSDVGVSLGAMGAIRVFVVEDNALTRHVLRVYLSREPHIELMGECDGTGDVASAVETSRRQGRRSGTAA